MRNGFGDVLTKIKTLSEDLQLDSLLSEAILELEQATAENQDKGGVAEHTEVPGVATSSSNSSVRPAISSPSSAGTVKVPLGVEFSSIHTFCWDQSNKFVRVYVSEGMEGVKGRHSRSKQVGEHQP